jgi:5-methylcytosine-specific restriction endonuclease McrA
MIETKWDTSSKIITTDDFRSVCKLNCFREIPCEIGCLKPTKCSVRNKIKELIDRKEKSANIKASAIGIHPITKEDILSVFIAAWGDGFKCKYSNKPLDIWATNNLESMRTATSLDHIIAISNGGTNAKENLELISHECNIIKGKVREKLFKAAIEGVRREYGDIGVDLYLSDQVTIITAIQMKQTWGVSK